MPTWCLNKTLAREFLLRLKADVKLPEKLASMRSSERREYFTNFLGEDNAKEVNALFESKLLLKNKKIGYITWAKRVGNLRPEIKKDILTRINKLEKVLSPEEEARFLEDLVAKKFGADITHQEAKQLVDLASKVEERKAAIPVGSPVRSKERVDYGLSYVLFQDYVQSLKQGGAKLNLLDNIKHPIKLFFKASGATKSFLSTLDNSFFGRQGIKALYTNPDIWAKNFLKSWGDISKELIGIDGMKAIKADVYSRPNSLNGTYQRAKIDIGIGTEEAFPSSLPEKIPLLKLPFKASQTAFNGAALRMRADLADRYFAKAIRQGVDTTDQFQAQSIGKLVNAMTGRGSIGKFEAVSKEINASLFSVKFLASNVATLVQPVNTSLSVFARKQAAGNLVKIVAGVAGVLYTAELLHPGSVELDPRSPNFGKIKIGDTAFDVTGGMASLVVLASRIMPSKHNGRWGFWQKSGKTEKWTQLGTGKYGVKSPLDVFEDYWEGKAAPIPALIRDVWKGETFAGEKVTPVNAIKGLITPISIQNIERLKEQEAANILAASILEVLGISNITYR